jgi:DNA modification methylase
MSKVAAFAVDESSILRGSGDGVIATNMIRSARPVPFRLGGSATPAPNDPTEYGAHAVFLGYMRNEAEFRARFFVRDGKDWRIKGHAREALPLWLSRFALWMRDPAAYGMPCDALPKEPPRVEVIPIASTAADRLGHATDMFGNLSASLDMSQRAALRGELYADPIRVEKVVELARQGPTIVWTMRNPQADAIARAMREAGLRVAQIAGTTSEEDRVRIVAAFQAGELDGLVSKHKVIGHGTNLQRADFMVYAGYDESYEALHQTMRRAHRQGRKGRLTAYMLATPEEMPIIGTLDTKERQWDEDSARQETAFASALAADVAAYQQGGIMLVHEESSVCLPEVRTPRYWLRHMDCVEGMAEMEENSVDLSVFSPPFAALFTYSSEAADMGNCSEHVKEEFNMHFAHFSDALFRVMKPGRVVCLHLAQLVAFRARHGRKGLRDFRGDVIRVMEDAGFLYYGEFVVPKNPQAAAIRTKSERLQFSQFKRDSLESSPALNDYILEFRKPGEQSARVIPDVSNEEWIRWASGVWGDIRETDVLSYQRARGDNDERHICPLQLGVIERCVRLWSNRGEVVFSPFMGIASEIHEAVRLGRIGWGTELKAEYFTQAVENAARAASTLDQPSMFDALEGAA